MEDYVIMMVPRLAAVQALAKEQLEVAQRVQAMEYNRRKRVGSE